MLVEPTPVAGAFKIVLQRLEDERGFFARTWCMREFETYGGQVSFVQCSTSCNKVKGTLRGMHFQTSPCEEDKLVRCTAGAIIDVIVDARLVSPTFRRWHAVELSAENRAQLYIPKGVAHGFQTLMDNTEVLYQMSEFYSPNCRRGFRYDDRSLAIQWPLKVTSISAKDMALPLFDAMDIFSPVRLAPQEPRI